jgi:Tfp pilus assembly protein PilX
LGASNRTLRTESRGKMKNAVNIIGGIALFIVLVIVIIVGVLGTFYLAMTSP